MSRLRWLICTLALVTSALAQSPSGKLKMVVILTRHGVRPPLSPNPKSPYAKEKWPSLDEWGARCAGDLTKTGYKLATLMGAYYSAYYIQQGLLPNNCPSQQVYIWADDEERTWETATALAEGLTQKFPGCSVPVDSRGYTPPGQDCKSSNQPDYFFHPLANQTLESRVDPKKMQDIAAGINLSLRRLHSLYAPELASLQKVLICCDASQCPNLSSCTLPTLPDQATVTADNKLQWQFRFSVGSTATENLLLEYANGMPCNATGSGWGRVTYDYTNDDCKRSGGQPFRRMQRIHTLYFERVNRVSYIATTQGSNLANQILQTLQKGAAGSAPPLVIFAGHDTNLANIAGMLHVSWALSDLPANDTPPAGALVFELYAGKSPSDFFVKLRYVHAKMAQLRTQSVLSLSNPPEWSAVTIPNCPHPCSFSTFQAIMTKAIDKNFTTASASGD